MFGEKDEPKKTSSATPPASEKKKPAKKAAEEKPIRGVTSVPPGTADAARRAEAEAEEEDGA